MQNCNDPPWTSTFPQQIDANNFPTYIASQQMDLRAQRSVRMLQASDRISFEQLIQAKQSTRLELADRILDELIAAAKQYGNDLTKEAVDVLEKWDREANADSRGMLLFEYWVEEMRDRNGNLSDIFATPWNKNNPRSTPKDLKNPRAASQAIETAANKIKAAYGALDMPWGNIARLHRGAVDLPANGGPGNLGIFRVIEFEPKNNGKLESVFGDTYIAAIEFSHPIRAKVLNTYGNASQADSPHNGDQLQLAARKQLRSVWRQRPEIEAHLASRQPI